MNRTASGLGYGSESPEDVKDSSILLQGLIDQLDASGAAAAASGPANINVASSMNMFYDQSHYQHNLMLSAGNGVVADSSHQAHYPRTTSQRSAEAAPPLAPPTTLNLNTATTNNNSSRTSSGVTVDEDIEEEEGEEAEEEGEEEEDEADEIVEQLPVAESSNKPAGRGKANRGTAAVGKGVSRNGNGNAGQSSKINNAAPAIDSNSSNKIKRTRTRRPASCENCRKKKFRCDRLLPCETCKQRGVEDTCSYGNGATPLHIPRGSDETAELRVQVDRLREIVEALTKAAPAVATTATAAAMATPSPTSTAPPPPPPLTANKNNNNNAKSQQKTSLPTPGATSTSASASAPASAIGGPEPSPRTSIVDFDSPRQANPPTPHGSASVQAHHELHESQQHQYHHHQHQNRPSTGGDNIEEPAESLRKMNLKALDICEALGQLSVTGVVRLDGGQPYNVPLMKEARAALGTPSANHPTNLGTFPFSSAPDSIEKIMAILPSLEQAATVITCFKRQLSWYIYFFPWSVFDKQLHTLRTSTTSNVDCSFLSIFLGVCGIGLYFLPDKQAGQFPQGQGKINLATSWLDASASALTLARFLDCPSLNSIHAMQLLTAWHVYLSPGDTSSTGFAVLNIAAEAVLQLGLHRDPDPAHYTPFEINLRRLTFWQTVMLETQAGSSLGKTWSLFQLQHCDTKLPMEKDEEAFLPNGYLREDYEPTEESIMTSILLRMRTSITSKQISERAFSIQDVSFSTVLELDRELHKLEDSFPPQYKLGFENKELTTAPGLSRLARLKTSMVNVGLLQEYIRLHRPFVASGSSFEVCRSTCLRAARITIAIFKELAAFNYGGLTFKAMMASCVVCMDLITHPNSSESSAMREDVNAVITLLDKNKDRSKLADNGVRIIRFLLAKSSPVVDQSPPLSLSLVYDVRPQDATFGGPGAALAYGLNKRARVDSTHAVASSWSQEPPYNGLVGAAPSSAASSVSPQSSNGEVHRDGKRRQMHGTVHNVQAPAQPTPRPSPSTSTSGMLHGMRTTSNEQQYPTTSPPQLDTAFGMRAPTNMRSSYIQQDAPQLPSVYASSNVHSSAQSRPLVTPQYYSNNGSTTYSQSVASSSTGLHTPITSHFPSLPYNGAYQPQISGHIPQQQPSFGPVSDNKAAGTGPPSSHMYSNGASYPSFDQTMNNFVAAETLSWQAVPGHQAASYSQNWQQP